jgi:hypothetical protein
LKLSAHRRNNKIAAQIDADSMLRRNTREAAILQGLARGGAWFAVIEIRNLMSQPDNDLRLFFISFFGSI